MPAKLMRYLKVPAVFCWYLLVCFCTHATADLILVDDHAPAAVIVTGRNPSLTERHAARELQHYLHLVSGVILPIVPDDVDLKGLLIFAHGQVHVQKEKTGSGSARKAVRIMIGRNRYADEEGIRVEAQTKFPDPIRIETRDGSIFIVGRGDRGTLYGVYQFLEEFVGCRWVMPGSLGEIIPHKGTVAVPEIARTYLPSFERRTSMSGWFVSAYSDDRYVEWMLKNRMQIIDADLDYLPDRGGVDIVDQGHRWGFLIEHDRYKDDHPEYLALNDRLRVQRLLYDGQFCSSNPEVIRRLKWEAAGFFESRPGADVMSLAPADGGHFCECRRCKALDAGDEYTAGDRTIVSLTDRIIRLTNAVAKAFPEKTFVTFAYHTYVRPPLRTRPLPNVMAILWHFNPTNYAAALNDPGDPNNSKFTALLNGWLDMDANILYGAYTSKSMWQQLPWPIARRLGRDLKYLHSIGVRNFTCMPHIPGRWGQLGPVIYLQAKLLWDVTLDAEGVLQDYYEHSYAAAAPAMEQYFGILEDAAQAPGVYFNNNPTREALNFLTPVVMARAGRYLEEARILANSDRVRERVELVEIAFEYARRYLEILHQMKRFDLTQDEKVLATAERLFEELGEYVKGHGHKDAVVYYGVELDVLGLQTAEWDFYYGLGRDLRNRQAAVTSE